MHRHRSFPAPLARARVGLRLQPAYPAVSAAVLTQADCGVPFAQWSDAARALPSHQDRFRNPIGACDAVLRWLVLTGGGPKAKQGFVRKRKYVGFFFHQPFSLKPGIQLGGVSGCQSCHGKEVLDGR